MRRTHYLFALLAFLCLAFPSRAEDKPLAACKDGQCVISEDDYKQLQAFVAEVKARAEQNDKIESQVNEMIGELRGALEICKERQKQWKTGFK